MNSAVFLIFLFVFNIAAVYVMDTVRDDRIVPLLADGFTGFIIEYIAVSTALILVGHYSVGRAMLAVAAMNTMLVTLLFAVRRRRPELRTRKIGVDRISGIIIVIGAAACAYRAGITMTSFHQNYYLYHAMSLMNYGVDDALATSCGDVDFYYGFPGYPSVLAIGGAIGGFKAVLNIQMLMSLALGVYLSLIADRMKITGFNKYCTIGFAMLSPIMISAGKAASDSLLICLLTVAAVREMLEFIYNSNAHKDVRKAAGVKDMIAGLDAKVFLFPAFAAVSMLFMITAKTLFFLPLIVAVFCIVYAYSGRIRVLVYCAGATAIQLAVCIIALDKFPNVFNHEWWSWLSAAGHDDDYGERAAIFMAVAWVVIALMLLLPTGRRCVKSLFADNGYIKGLALFAVVLAAVAIGKMYYIYSEESKSKISLESTFAVSVATGLIIIPGAMLYLLVRSRKLPVPAHMAITATIAVYGLFMICDSEIPYINRVGLEMAPMLPFVIFATLLAGHAMNENKTSIKKQIGFCIAAAVIMVPMSLFAVCYRPETAMDMNDLENIVTITDRGHNAIFIDEEAQPLQFAVRLTCHSDVYLEGENIPEGYDNIYVLSFEKDDGTIVSEMTPANSDIAVNGAPEDDIGAYYPIIFLKRIDDGRTIYLKIQTASEGIT